MSANNFPRVTAILNAIPDAATRWPGWMWPCCPLCLGECEEDSNKVAFCGHNTCDNYWNDKPITPVYRFSPATDGQGADVWHGNDTDPRNMHHLWAMLEAVSKPRCVSIQTCGMPNHYKAEVAIEARRWKYGLGNPSIIEAMLRCLEEATR